MSSAPAQATFVIETTGDHPVVVVAGELDLANVGQLEASVAGLIDSAEVTHVDLSGVTFADSASLGTLVSLHERAVAAGNLLCVSAVSDVIDALFHIAGLSDVLRC